MRKMNNEYLHHRLDEIISMIEKSIETINKNQVLFFRDFEHFQMLFQKKSKEHYKTIEMLRTCKDQVDELKGFFKESMTSYLNRCFENET